MTLFDSVLALLIAILAWRSVTAPDLYRGIVLFITLGLMLALSWARLDAPDLALAEAAIGAGLLGILLLSTWRVLQRAAPRQGSDEPASYAVRWLAVVGSTVFGGTVAVALYGLQVGSDRAGAEALASLDLAGIDQPVTAVLLNFRSYDTLLEMGVLLMALIGALLIRSPLAYEPWHGDTAVESPLMSVLAKVFTPIVVLVGIFLVWAGAYGPGGAFQGGAVLAGAGVLLLLCRRLYGDADATLLLRGLLVLGVTAFIVIGLLLMPWQGAFLAYPPGLVYVLLVVIEFSLAVSIALSLLLLFTGTHAVRAVRS